MTKNGRYGKDQQGRGFLDLTRLGALVRELYHDLGADSTSQQTPESEAPAGNPGPTACSLVLKSSKAHPSLDN